MFYCEALNLGRIDCYVKLDVLTEEQIANMCRPKPLEIVDAPEAVAFIEVQFDEGRYYHSKYLNLFYIHFDECVMFFFSFLQDKSAQLSQTALKRSTHMQN